MADVEIGTVTITTLGGPVLLIGKARLGVTTSTVVKLWLTSVGGTQLDESFAGAGDVGTGVVIKIETPVAGTYTYKLSGDTSGSGGWADFRKLQALELKK